MNWLKTDMLFSRCFGRLYKVALTSIRTQCTVLPRAYKMSANRRPFERLPTNVLPVNYALKLTPNLTEFTFDGVIKICVDVKEPTKAVIVNAAELKINSCSFKAPEPSASRNAKITLQEKEETAKFEFDDELPVGKGDLEIQYTGTLNDKMKGFYRTRYTTPWGEERYAAATQFEVCTCEGIKCMLSNEF